MRQNLIHTHLDYKEDYKLNEDQLLCSACSLPLLPQAVLLHVVSGKSKMLRSIERCTASPTSDFCQHH
jgi:hypothetical protein